MSFRVVFFVVLLLSETALAQPYVLAAEDDYYPFSAEIDGRLVGLVPELCEGAFQVMGQDVQFQTGPYSRALMLVRTGQVVGGFTGAIDASNESEFHWHKTPLSSVRLVIWGRRGSGESGLDAQDLEGRTVAVTHGFFYPDAVDRNEAIRKTVAPSDQSALKMLALGRSDYALVTESIGYQILEASRDPLLKGQVEIVGLIDEVPLYVFFSRAHPEGEAAAASFQQGLEALMGTGEYERILRRWLPRSPLSEESETAAPEAGF